MAFKGCVLFLFFMLKFSLASRDDFSGELQFDLPGVPYNMKYKNVQSEEYKKFTQFLQNKINSILDNKNAIYPNHPSFDITSLRKRRDTISVKGEVSMLKNGDQLKSWSYLAWMNYYVHDIKRRFTWSEIDNIKILNEGACNGQTGYAHCGRHLYEWPPTLLGKTESLPCSCNASRFAYKTCVRYDGKRFAEYGETNKSGCDRTNELNTLSKGTVTSQNARDISKRLQAASIKGKLISSNDVTLVADVLAKFHWLVNTSAEVENNIMASIDNVLGVGKGLLRESEEKDGTTSRVITLLGDFTDELSSTKPYTMSRKNFALNGVRKPVAHFNGLSVAATYNKDANRITMRENDAASVRDRDTVDASVVIPSNIIKSLPNTLKDIKVITVVYKSDHLFVDEEDSNYTVNSQVLSTEIRGQHVTGLPEPITLSFRARNTSLMRHDKKCAYWNVTGKEWSTEGCRLVNDDVTDMVTCECDHMTNFAVLFNAIPPDGLHGDILTWITYTGLIVSLVATFLTLLTYSMFPMLRDTIPPKILINLCTALIALKLLFLIGAEATSSKLGCKSVAILLHYFFVAVFTWSGVEGFHSARGLVFPMKVEITMFMQKALVFGWGTPCLLTALGAGIWYHEYGEGDSCVVEGAPFYYTVLIPIFMIITFNFVALTGICFVLAKRSRKYKSQTMTMQNRLRIIIGFVLLLGVTWTFGFFVIIGRDVILFQYLFCIFCSLQGVYLFALYGIRQDKHRKCWRKLLRGHSIKEINRHIKRKSQQSFSTKYENDVRHTHKDRLLSMTSSSDKLTSNSTLSTPTTEKKFSSITIKLGQQKNVALPQPCTHGPTETCPSSPQAWPMPPEHELSKTRLNKTELVIDPITGELSQTGSMPRQKAQLVIDPIKGSIELRTKEKKQSVEKLIRTFSEET